MRREQVAGIAKLRAGEPSLSVVIPSRDRCELVVGLVERLLDDTGFLEIIVVNDGSTDETAARLSKIAWRDGRLRVLLGAGSGPTAARALGASNARGNIVLFLDDDVMPDRGLPRMHASRHSPTSQRVVVGYMPTNTSSHPGPETFATLLYAHEYEARCEKYEQDPSRVLRNLWMGNVSMPREAYLDVTLRWPEPLPHGRHEDQHIGLRLLSIGLSATFDRELRGVHQHHRTIRQFRRDCRLMGTGRAALETQYPNLVDRAGVRQFREGLHLPLAALVAVSANRRVGTVAASALATMTHALGASAMFRAQTAVARLLRRVEQQQGYLSQAHTSGFAAVGLESPDPMSLAFDHEVNEMATA